MDKRGRKYILFVDYRNNDLSIMAETFAKRELESTGIDDIVFYSRATDKKDNLDLERSVKKGLSTSLRKEFRYDPQQLTIDDLTKADLIVAMDRSDMLGVIEFIDAATVMYPEKNNLSKIIDKMYDVKTLSDVYERQYVDDTRKRPKLFKFPKLPKFNVPTHDINKRIKDSSSIYRTAMKIGRTSNMILKNFKKRSVYSRNKKNVQNFTHLMTEDMLGKAYTSFITNKIRISSRLTNPDLGGVFGIDKVDPSIRKIVEKLNDYTHAYTLGKSCSGHIIEKEQMKALKEGYVNVVFSPGKDSKNLKHKLEKLAKSHSLIRFYRSAAKDPETRETVINHYTIKVSNELDDASPKQLTKGLKEQKRAWSKIEKIIFKETKKDFNRR